MHGNMDGFTRRPVYRSFAVRADVEKLIGCAAGDLRQRPKHFGGSPNRITVDT